MAINYYELKEKIDNTPLSEYDLTFVKNLEDYIDQKILEQFDRNIYGEISIDMCYVNFAYCPKTNKPILGHYISKLPKMRREIERRFEEAGWSIKYTDNDIDMNSTNYMILKGKK